MNTHKEIIKIEVDVEDGYEAKWNPETKQIDITKKLDLPMSWDDLLKTESHKKEFGFLHRNYDDLGSNEELLAFASLGRLIQLRDEWWKILNWKPDWNDITQIKWTIHSYGRKVIKGDAFTTRYNFILVFPTEEIRDKFYDAFRMEIEQAYMFL